MFCTRKVNDDYTWVGADGRRLAMFEGVYDVPRGVSFNSYLLTDGKTVLFDTADASVCRVFLENVAHGLNGRALDYLVKQSRLTATTPIFTLGMLIIIFSS